MSFKIAVICYIHEVARRVVKNLHISDYLMNEYNATKHQLHSIHTVRCCHCWLLLLSSFLCFFSATVRLNGILSGCRLNAD